MDSVRRALEKDIGSGSANKSQVRGVIATTRRGKERGRRGLVDDILRYLINQGFLVQGEGGRYKLTNPPKIQEFDEIRHFHNPPLPQEEVMSSSQRKIDTSNMLEHVIATFRSGEEGSFFYEFTASAEQLAKNALFDRFEDNNESGVQRGLKNHHVNGIVRAMKEGIPFPENIVVNLVGSWVTDSRDLLGDTAGEVPARYEVIDGQHRLIAIIRLIEEGDLETVQKYQFKVTAVLNASDDQRRELFRLQTRRMRVDSAHALELANQDGKFRRPSEENAYRLARALNDHVTSPLKGRILFGERTGENGRRRASGEGIFHVSSFRSMLLSLGSNRTPLKDLPIDQKQQIVVDLFRAFERGTSVFMKKGHELSTTNGICSILTILAVDGKFHVKLDYMEPDLEKRYSYENMLEVVRMASHFTWTPRSDAIRAGTRRRPSPLDIAERFNAFLSKR